MQVDDTTVFEDRFEDEDISDWSVTSVVINRISFRVVISRGHGCRVWRMVEFRRV